MGLWEKIKSIFSKKVQPKLLPEGNELQISQAQKNDTRKVISRPSTSQKLALLLSTGVLVLPLAACRSNNETGEKPITEVVLCDTSDIRLSKYIEKYIADFESGDISDGTEMYTYYKELYELLKQEPVSETDGMYKNSQNTTYNFNKEPMIFDTYEDGLYYANGEPVKDVQFSSVDIKTIDGNIKIENIDESYTIINTDDINSIETVIQYNSDGSWTISEDRNEKSEIFKFDDTGMLESSEMNNNDGRTKTVYRNGDINFYNIYSITKFFDANDGWREKERETLIEEKIIDGSYIIYDSGELDQARYNMYPDSRAFYDQILYYYDKNDNLIHIKAYNPGAEVIFFPNGDYYIYEKYFDENGTMVKSRKIERKFNQYKTEIVKDIDENGETKVIVTRWDDDVFNHMGGLDITYYSENNVVLKERKDGIIYCYHSHDGKYHKVGDFYEAYQVQEDGVMYYREDTTKLRFERNDGTKISYNENESVYSIDNGTTYTKYYNYDENIILLISNNSDEEITVEANGKEFKLSSTGYVSFYENGDTQDYYYDENTGYKYYESGECKSEKDGISTLKDEYGNVLWIQNDTTYTQYYNYDENSISQISNNSDEEITVEANGKEFKLSPTGYVSFYENGDTQNYYYDRNTHFHYYESGQWVSVENGVRTEHDKDDKITSIHLSKDGQFYDSYTEYYDYEKNLIKRKKENQIVTSYYYNQQMSKIENNNEDGVIISVNDIYGNVYDLSNGDSAYFYEKGNFSYVKQGDIVKKFYRNDNQEYYYKHNETDNTYTFYHNDEILYTTDNPDCFSIIYKDGAQRVVLEDGTIIDPDIQEEVIENTEVVPDEEIATSNNFGDYDDR